MNKTFKRHISLFAILSAIIMFSAETSANGELLKMLKSHKINKTEVQMIIDQMNKNGQINKVQLKDATTALKKMNKSDFKKLQMKGHAAVKSKGMVNLTDTANPDARKPSSTSLPNHDQIDRIMKALKN